MERFIKQLVVGSGKILRREFRSIGVAGKSKSDALDIVTHVDLLAEKNIISAIKRKFPKHQILSEEAGDNQLKSDHLWVIDPLDGTLNFARGIPEFVTQVAYIKNGQIEFAAVYDPMNSQLFYAQRGKGAFCNGKQIKCSQVKDYKNCIVTLNAFYNTDTLKLINKVSTASKNRHFRVRNTGALGLAGVYTASGKFDYLISNSGKFWDYAPPAMILKEAGCVVKNFKGKDWKFTDKEFIAGNKTLVNSVLKVLAK